MEEIEKITSLKNLVDIYGQIASARMIKIRNSVLKNREFLAKIGDIFKDTLGAYAENLSDLLRKGKIKKTGRVTFLAHNGKTVSVLVSANTGFFGDIVQETYRKFLEETKSGNTEVTIIGSVGKSLFIIDKPQSPYTYFDFPDYGIDKAKMSEIIQHLVPYEEIKVYYGKYTSVIKQDPISVSISAGTPLGVEIVKPKARYIFEPSVEKILTFFETEIFASLLDQSIRESQLAKLASRIVSMDSASIKIKEKIGKLKIRELRIRHHKADHKQLNMLSSFLYSDSV